MQIDNNLKRPHAFGFNDIEWQTFVYEQIKYEN